MEVCIFECLFYYRLVHVLRDCQRKGLAMIKNVNAMKSHELYSEFLEHFHLLRDQGDTRIRLVIFNEWLKERDEGNKSETVEETGTESGQGSTEGANGGGDQEDRKEDLRRQSAIFRDTFY